MTNEDLILQKLDRIELFLKAYFKDIMTIKECATYLNVSEDRVRHLTSEGELPYYKNKGKTLISRHDVELWQTRERIPSKYEVCDIATTYTAISKN